MLKKIYLFAFVVFLIYFMAGCSSRGIAVAGYRIVNDNFNNSSVGTVESELETYKDNNISLTDEEVLFIIIDILNTISSSCYNITKLESTSKIYYICTEKSTVSVFELRNRTLYELDFDEYYSFAKIYYRDRNPDGFMSPEFKNFYIKKTFIELIDSANNQLNNENTTIEEGIEYLFERLVVKIFGVDFSIFNGKATIINEKGEECYPSLSNCQRWETWTKGIVVTKDLIEYGYIKYTCRALTNNYKCFSTLPKSIDYYKVSPSKEFQSEIDIIYDLAKIFGENPSSITEQDYLNYSQLMNNENLKNFFFKNDQYYTYNAKALLDEILTI